MKLTNFIKSLSVKKGVVNYNANQEESKKLNLIPTQTHMYAKLALDHSLLKKYSQKSPKALPAQRHGYLMKFRQVSISKACRVVKLPKSMYYYKNVRDDSEITDKLLELSERHLTEGRDLCVV
jgi:hypothetical protein